MTKILITGAGGLVGRALLAELAQTDHQILATDLHQPDLPPNAEFRRMDVTGWDPANIIAQERPQVVVHLASVVTPPKGSNRALEYAVDVTGTQNVLNACLQNGVRRLIVTSSGAAYGYHPRNIHPLTEDIPPDGNPEFAYSHHKKLVEDMLARARTDHPNWNKSSCVSAPFWAMGWTIRSPRCSANPACCGWPGPRGRLSLSGRAIWRGYCCVLPPMAPLASITWPATGRFR